MDFLETVRTQARQLARQLVLPEGTEPRTLRAARILVDERLAGSVTLLGNEEAVRSAAATEGVDLAGLSIIDPAGSESRQRYANEYYELRKHKGMTDEQAYA
ncbi:MAG: phosphate acetyltransferase, partial [Spirochaetaceae bacterium]